jgi:hypothetical protein
VEPRTLRRIGGAAIVFGSLGLAWTVVLVGLAATGAAGMPSAFTVAIVAVQSVLNVAVGWNLRRRATDPTH